MARTKSGDKRNGILAAATRVIVAQGVSAPTATIAKEAGVANGTLFTYFETKSELLNELYLELKGQMVAEVSSGMGEELQLRERLFRVWSNWMAWATDHPEKRMALAQLGVCEEITPETRAAANAGMARVAELVEQVRVNGPLAEAPPGLVAELMTALGDATSDYIIGDPDNAEAHCRMGFEALWRVLA